MLLLSKIRFYLPIGLLTSLFVFITLREISPAMFIVSTMIYFLTGLFLGWRIENHTLLAASLLLIPLTIFAAYIHFVHLVDAIKYIYIIVAVSFLIGFLISKFWNYSSMFIKVVFMLLLLTSAYCYHLVYILLLF